MKRTKERKGGNRFDCRPLFIRPGKAPAIWDNPQEYGRMRREEAAEKCKNGEENKGTKRGSILAGGYRYAWGVHVEALKRYCLKC